MMNLLKRYSKVIFMLIVKSWVNWATKEDV